MLLLLGHGPTLLALAVLPPPALLPVPSLEHPLPALPFCPCACVWIWKQLVAPVMPCSDETEASSCAISEAVQQADAPRFKKPQLWLCTMGLTSGHAQNREKVAATATV